MNISNLSQRRLVEQLSGWQLKVFFVSAIANLGFLGLLNFLPLVFSGPLMQVVLAFVAASHCVFLMCLAGFRFPISIKSAFGAAHAVACIGAINNVGSTSEFQLATDGWWLLLIPAETLVMTVGGVWFARRSGFHQQHRFSVSDVLIIVTAFAILFPILLRVWPPISISFFKSGDYLAAGSLACLNGWWALIIVNQILSFKFKPRIKNGEADDGNPSPGQRFIGLAIGTFLLSAILNWDACQSGLLAALWILASSLPLIGLRDRNVPSAVQVKPKMDRRRVGLIFIL